MLDFRRSIGVRSHRVWQRRGGGGGGSAPPTQNTTIVGGGDVSSAVTDPALDGAVVTQRWLIKDAADTQILIDPPPSVTVGDLVVAVAHTDGDETFNSTDWTTTYAWTIHDYKNASTGRGSHNIASFVATAGFVADTNIDLGTGTSEHGGAMMFRFPSGWAVDGVDTQGIIGPTSYDQTGDLPTSVTTANANGVLLSFLFTQSGGRYDGNTIRANTGWDLIGYQEVADGASSVLAGMFVFGKTVGAAGSQTIGQPWTYTSTFLRTSATIALSKP